jgi:uncharacterized protein (TIGR01777 family)
MSGTESVTRSERIMDIEHQTADDGPRALRIVVSGASGLIGSALTSLLTAAGHRVIPMVRRPPRHGEIGWDPEAGRIDRTAFEGADAVVHLAGESIAGGRWTARRKRRIRESRTRGTGLLADAIASLQQPPAVLVSASAIGVYGDRGDELLDERSPPGQGFLSELVQAWEAAAAPAGRAGIRIVHPRFGMVMSAEGGALARMLPVFRAGLGGRLGNGEQYMSPVSIDDVAGAIHHGIVTGSLHGPANVTCPAPVSNREFTRTVAAVLRRPAPFAVPRAALRLAMGEMADELLFYSARVMPAALVASGYRFQHPTLESALRQVLGR